MTFTIGLEFKSQLRSNRIIYLGIFIVVIAGAAVFQLFESKQRSFMGASSSSNMSQAAIVPPKEKATASLIFLHGLGDTGHGWSEMFRELKLNNIRCVCPHASLKPVTLNGGMMMPAWFDIKGLSQSSPEDEPGIKEASKQLQDLIEKEISQGIPAERIIIGGFSQGGAIAVYTAFSCDIKIGGLLLLSTWLPLHKQFSSEGDMKDSQDSCLCFPKPSLCFCPGRKKAKYNQNIPVLQCHGKMDPMVPFVWGKATNDIIRTINSNVQFNTYPDMGHHSCPKEMEDVKVFLNQTMKESSGDA